MTEFKKFRSTGEPIRIVSTSGHVAIIEKDFVSVPDILWSTAYASGAISEDMQASPMDPYIQTKKQEQEEKDKLEFEEIKAALRKVFDSPPGYLDANGNLVHRKALALIGKPVKKAVIDQAWEELKTELEE